MRLRDLEAQFLKITGPDTRQFVETLAEAQGVMFVCPKCYNTLGGRAGAHMVICWFRDRGVPDNETPGPGRWNVAGTSLDDLTFVGPEACSVQLNGGCAWHGYVRSGDAA